MVWLPHCAIGEAPVGWGLGWFQQRSQPTQKGEHRQCVQWQSKKAQIQWLRQVVGCIFMSSQVMVEEEMCACGRQPCLSKRQGWGRIVDLWRWRQSQWRRGETKALLFPWDSTWLRPWVHLLVCFGLLKLEKELCYRSINTSWVFTDWHDGCRPLTVSPELHVGTFALLTAAWPFLELRSRPGWPFLLQPTGTGCWASFKICACI